MPEICYKPKKFGEKKLAVIAKARYGGSNLWPYGLEKGVNTNAVIGKRPK